MDSLLPVLIVGGGPTGLMLACELARHGIAFRIIDEKPERTKTSNATWIQTRSLELLDKMGIAERFIKAGNRCNAINLYLAGKKLTTLSLNNIDSIYPFILMLPQSETERLLIEYLAELKQKVERPFKLIDIKQENNVVTSTVQLPNGKTDIIQSRYVVACDGLNSIIRQKCQIDFPGDDLSEQFMVADATSDSFMSTNEVHVFFDEGTFFAASPLGGTKYRIFANLHFDQQRQNFIAKEVIEMVQERGHGAYYVKDISWVTPFFVHGRIAKEMRKESIFLAGDAAHVHSPVGGQGMNAGLQDAFNLAWKLALVINKKAKESLLDSYQVERYPIDKQIVQQSNELTKMFFSEKKFITHLQHFCSRISKTDKALAKKVNEQTSQVGLAYKKSPIIDYDYVVNPKAPKSGERLRDVKITDAMTLSSKMRDIQHTILFFAGSAPTKKTIQEVIHLQEWLNHDYAGLINSLIITGESLADIKNVILDSNFSIHHQYHVTDPTLYVIRPDNYIGYCGSLDKARLQKYLSKSAFV